LAPCGTPNKLSREASSAVEKPKNLKNIRKEKKERNLSLHTFAS